MSVTKPYEMTFTEFAEAIGPAWSVSIARNMRDRLPYSEWLTSVSRHTRPPLSYRVSWANEELRNELPPQAREYDFNDVDLHKFTEGFGLDSTSQGDNIKASELVAARQAWIISIQDWYAKEPLPPALSPEITADHVLLTSGFNHSWVKEQIRLHKLQENERAPDHSNTHDQAHLQSMIEDKERNISHWIDEFQFEKGRWTSIFESEAWHAQEDINEATRKMHALEYEIKKQKEIVSDSENTIQEFKTYKAVTKGIGRPKKSPARQAIAKKFTSQWVRSLMNALEINNCAKLAEHVDGSNQMTWGRWLKEETVPPYEYFLTFGYAEILLGKFSGKKLQDVQTSPCYDDLKSLVRLIYTGQSIPG